MLANNRSYGSRSFSSLIAFGSGIASEAAWSLPPAGAGAVEAGLFSFTGATTMSSVGVGCFVLLLRDVDERHHVGVDDLERRLGAQLAAQQPHGFLVGVDVVAAAGDEAGDEHALERRYIQLRLDRRFDRNLVGVGAARDEHDRGSGRGERGSEQPTCPCPELVRSLISLNSS